MTLPVVSALLAFVVALFRSRRSMQLEILALHHQLAVHQRSVSKPRIQPADRLLWAWLARLWSGWRDALSFVQPRTVLMWQHRWFREYWRRFSQGGKPGRPAMPKEDRELIRTMSQANPTWGVPGIVGELRQLGIDVAKSTVEKYRVRPRTPPSPTWKTFLTHHIDDLASLDFFTVPTVTHRVLFVLVILAHHRRQVVHFNITEHPTAEWTAQQVVEAFPWNEAPRYFLRDRDRIYGTSFRQRVRHMGVEEVVITSRSHRRSPGMIAVKLKGTVTKDHRLELTMPPSVPPGEVEVIVLHPEPPPRPCVRGRKQPPTVHPAAGMWADREDIGDTIAFVSQLRQRLETRYDAPQ